MALNAIHLVERGEPAALPRVNAQETGLLAALQTLADRGILKLRMTGSLVLVEPNQFVGRLAHPGGTVTIAPRRPELFRALIERLSPSHRQVDVPKLDRDAGGTTAPLEPAAALKAALAESVKSGLPFDYERRPTESSNLKGRLLIRSTIRRFSARGVHHKAMTSIQEQRIDPRLRCVVAATLRSLALEQHADARDLGHARDLAIVLGTSSERCSTQRALGAAEELTPLFRKGDPTRNLLEVCVAILESSQFLWTDEVVATDHAGRFTNMDFLWELFTLSIAQEAQPSRLRAELHPLRSQPLRLLGESGPSIDPDVVLFDRDEIVGVLDAKYSERSAPGASDIYQLYAYVIRTGARIGALIYVASGDGWHQTIGFTKEGSRLLAAGVNGMDLEDSARQVSALITGPKARV